MFTSLIGAVGVADIIVFAVLGLGLLAGLIGGLSKAFKGLFAAGAVVLVSLLIVGYTVSPLVGSSIGQSLSGALEGSVKGWGAAFTSTVYIAEADGQPVKEDGKFVYCIKGEDGEMLKLQDAAGSGMLDKLKGKLAVKIAERSVNEENSGEESLAGYAADALTKIIFDVALFIVYCIVLGLIFKLFSRWSLRLSQSESAALRFTNRVLGAVVAAGLALLTLLLVFAIIKIAAPAGSSVAKFFEQGGIAGALFSKNPMSKIFAKII